MNDFKDYDKAKEIGEKWASRKMNAAQKQEDIKASNYAKELRKRAFSQLDPSYVKSFTNTREKIKMPFDVGAITEKNYLQQIKRQERADLEKANRDSYNAWLSTQENKNWMPYDEWVKTLGSGFKWNPSEKQFVKKTATGQETMSATGSSFFSQSPEFAWNKSL
jgi:hypothetical protein